MNVHARKGSIFVACAVIFVAVCLVLVPMNAWAAGNSVTGTEGAKLTATALSTSKASGTVAKSTKKKSKKSKTVKITFKSTAKGSKGKMKTQTVKIGKNSHLLKNKFTRKGYKFVGWNTKKNGKGRGYSDSDYIYFYKEDAGKKITLYARWKKASKLKVRYYGQGYSESSVAKDMVLVIGKSLCVNANGELGRIAKIKSSNTRVLKPTSKESALPLEVGKAELTITDIYGQSVKGTFVVRVTADDKTYTSSRLDTSLKVPTIAGVRYRYQSASGRGWCSASVFCPASFEDGDTSQGYQIRCSSDKKAQSMYSLDSVSTVNSDSKCVVMGVDTYVPDNPKYYWVRAYRKDGSTMVYGPWSSMQTAQPPDFSKKRSGVAKYTYQLYYLDSAQKTFIDGRWGERPVFIKTDNPDPNTIVLMKNGERFDLDDAVYNTWVYNIAYKSYSRGRTYADVQYSNTYDCGLFLRKVEGGYITYMQFGKGSNTLQVCEADQNGYVVAKQLTIEAVDGNVARDAWIDDVIAKAATDDMNPKEKMDAVEKWINEREGFKYLTNRNGLLVTLAKTPNSPYFETKRWDSGTSPEALALIANRIGGFEKVQSLYHCPNASDPNWVDNHSNCRVVYEGQEYTYSVCPTVSSGDVGSVSYIDFGNVSNLYPMS